MQGTNPAAGLAQREMSRTQSEGQFVASFINIQKKHLPSQSAGGFFQSSVLI